MIEGRDSFTYPQIIEQNCVHCGLCEHLCPALNQQLQSPIDLRVGKLKNSEEVLQSASGGAFWSIVNILLSRNYICSGVKFDINFIVRHSFARQIDDCTLFRKSKYIQSDTTDIYRTIKTMLSNGNKILFSGTPCQVSALRNYVGDNDNLFLIDIICHGVTSQAVFNAELNYLESKHKSTIKEFEFKTKSNKFGIINTRRALITLENGKSKIIDKYNDPFLRGYYTRLFYRESCKTCPFAKFSRSGDITIGDAWDIETIYPDFKSLSGISLILFNTEKGYKLLPEMKQNMDLRIVDGNWAKTHNEQLRQPTKLHPNHNLFFESFYKDSNFKKLVFKLVPITKKELMLNSIKNHARGIIKWLKSQ